MRKLLFILLFLPFVGCTQTYKEKIFVIDVDSLNIYNAKIKLLTDSIVKLNKRPVMTAQQFIQLYKYERLVKYYTICKRKSSQWKYYKGWSIRVFEQ